MHWCAVRKIWHIFHRQNLGNYALIAESGIEVFDVSDLSNPFKVDSLNTPGVSYGITIANDQIYLADYYSLMIFHSNLTGIKDDNPLPESFSLLQNYPNPFNNSTTIKYRLSKTSNVSIEIFDILGNKVELLVAKIKDAGDHEVSWNAGSYSSGLYFARLIVGTNSKTIKMILLK